MRLKTVMTRTVDVLCGTQYVLISGVRGSEVSKSKSLFSCLMPALEPETPAKCQLDRRCKVKQ